MLISFRHCEAGEGNWLQGEAALQAHSFRDADPQPVIPKKESGWNWLQCSEPVQLYKRKHQLLQFVLSGAVKPREGKGSLTHIMNQSIMTVLVEQPLASPGSAKHTIRLNIMGNIVAGPNRGRPCTGFSIPVRVYMRACVRLLIKLYSIVLNS